MANEDKGEVRDEVEDKVEKDQDRDQGMVNWELSILPFFHLKDRYRHPEATRFSVWPKDLRYQEIKGSGVRIQQLSILLFFMKDCYGHSERSPDAF
jgi:hypothetical protein